MQLNVLKLFPRGRIFASRVQLRQCLEMFSQSWAFKLVTNGKSFQCHYREKKKKQCSQCKTYNKLDEDTCLGCAKKLNSSTRVTEPSVICNCPFKINYQLLGYHKKKKHPLWKLDLFYKVPLDCVHLVYIRLLFISGCPY